MNLGEAFRVFVLTSFAGLSARYLESRTVDSIRASDLGGRHALASAQNQATPFLEPTVCRYYSKSVGR